MLPKCLTSCWLLLCFFSGYPSSLPALSAAASARQLPVLVVGAALNTDVVPPEANWKRFTGAAAAGNSPVWELVLRGSSHLQFLDKQQPLFALFSSNGPTPDEVVRQVTQVVHTDSVLHLTVCEASVLVPQRATVVVVVLST